MRKLFIDSGIKFFKDNFKIDVNRKKNLTMVLKVLEEQNVRRSKYVNLLPTNDLKTVVSRPCLVKIWPHMPAFKPEKDMDYLNENISSFKKLRLYLGVEEAKVCAACKLSQACKLKDRVPEQKVASTKDVYTVMYFMVKHAQYHLYKETAQKTGQQDLSELEQGPLTDEELLKAEAERQLGSREKVGEEDPMTPAEEFKLYLAGIRMFDNLRQIRADSEETREELAELIEQNIKEYSVKKQIDYILDDTNLLKESSMGEKRKRMEQKGMHDLVAASREKMAGFSRERPKKEDKKDRH